MDNLKKYILYLIIAIGLVISGWFFYAAIKNNPLAFLQSIAKLLDIELNSNHGTVFIHDTTVIMKSETLLKEVKVPTFIDRIVYKYPDPDSVKIQPADTVYLEKVKYLDLMVSLKKLGGNVWIYAVNQNGKVVKEYSFSGIGNSFTAVADSNNILLRSNNFEWNGISLYANLSSPFNLDSIKKPTVKAGIETGFTAFSRFSIDPGVQYNFIGNKFDLNNFQINLKTSYKIKL